VRACTATPRGPEYSSGGSQSISAGGTTARTATGDQLAAGVLLDGQAEQDRVLALRRSADKRSARTRTRDDPWSRDDQRRRP
jgi:hypothetical protein